MRINFQSWIIRCAIGEALGICIVALTFAGLERGVLHSSAFWVLAAGAMEGLLLGGAQASLLRNINVKPWRWIGITVAAASIGYGLSLFGQPSLEDSQTISQSEPSIYLLALMGAAFGLAMGVVMGGMQWMSARSIISLKSWIVGNMFGWTPAMAIIMCVASSFDAEVSYVQIGLFGALAGAVAGACVGLGTYQALSRADSNTLSL